MSWKAFFIVFFLLISLLLGGKSIYDFVDERRDRETYAGIIIATIGFALAIGLFVGSIPT